MEEILNIQIPFTWDDFYLDFCIQCKGLFGILKAGGLKSYHKEML